jgi:gluconate kinase
LMFAGTAVVMGVSATGKTEVASRLAEQLGAFPRVDWLHALARAAKMTRCGDLTKADPLALQHLTQHPGVAPCTAVIK